MARDHNGPFMFREGDDHISNGDIIFGGIDTVDGSGAKGVGAGAFSDLGIIDCIEGLINQ